MPAAREPVARIYRSGRGGQPWRWSLAAGNGEIVAAGEGYASQENAARGFETMRQCAIEAIVRLEQAPPPPPTYAR